MKQMDLHSLAPCSMSGHCLRLIDDLDKPIHSQHFEQFSFTRDVEEERLVEELRVHIPTCPTCTAVLAHARRIRTQQRTVLYNLLIESEQKVPSTTGQILAVLPSQQKELQPVNGSSHRKGEPLSPIKQLGGSREVGKQSPHRRQTNTMLRNAVALVVAAAVILSVVGIYSFRNVAGILTSHSKTQQQPTITPSNGWDSVVIGLAHSSPNFGQMTIDNYDPSSGKSTPLVTSPIPANTQLDGISHDGQNLLYRVPNENGQTHYYTLAQTSHSSYFFSLKDSEAGNAIWMPDSQHVLIATASNGIAEVDTRTGQVTRPLPGLKTSRLTFFRDSYVYFIGAEGLVEGALYRINITGGSPQQITMRSPGSEFWLSPDGSFIFYANKGSAGEQAIYVVKSDGTNAQILRKGDGIPVGYADDNALMLVQEIGGKFELVKLGATPQQHEEVVLNDIAPHASSLCKPQVIPGISPICESNIAVAPYGHTLIAHAYYADGSSRIVYDDLLKGTSQTLLALASNTEVQLPGWDRLTVTKVSTTQGPPLM